MPGEPVRVLFVDDEPKLADMYAAHLSDEYETETANDGPSALERIDDSIDVVFLDRRMPGPSGDRVLDTIRERDHDVKVVMLTAVEPDVDIVEMGYDEYVVKPVDEEELRETVEALTTEPPVDIDADILDALGDPKSRRCCAALLGEPASAQEVADRTGYSLTTVYRRLNALQQAGIVESQDNIDPDGSHYKTFRAVNTRIRIEIADSVDVDVERHDGREQKA